MSRDNFARSEIKALKALTSERCRLQDERFQAQGVALQKAEGAFEKRVEGLNEFRGQSEDRQKTYATQAEVNAKFEAVSSDYRRLETSVAANTARGVGIGQLAGWLIGGAGVATAIAVAVLK